MNESQLAGSNQAIQVSNLSVRPFRRIVVLEINGSDHVLFLQNRRRKEARGLPVSQPCL